MTTGLITSLLDSMRARAFLVEWPSLSVNYISSELVSRLTPPSDSPPRIPLPLSIGELWPDGGIILQKQLGSNPELGKEFEISGELNFRHRRIHARLRVVKLAPDSILVQPISSLSQVDTEAAMHSQRTELLGRLAAGIAHDFNNVLAGMLGHVAYLKMILPTAGAHIESLTAIEDGGKRASSMTQQILNFSRHGPVEEVAAVNINNAISRTCSLVRAALPPSISLDYTPLSNELQTLITDGKLTQLLINLIMNARDASGEGGKISIHARVVNELRELAEAFGSTELAARSYVRVSVIDSGHGIPPEVLPRIFEPYFSTKGRAGTGLGLATVAAIVRQFGGAVAISSQVGKGTKIDVYLPLIEARGLQDELKPPSSETERKPLRGTRERILVVDDEPSVRNVLALSLHHLGYEVESASCGLEAIEMFSDSRDAPFDLVILDMLMPDLSGNQVFFRLKALDPAVRVLLVSGYASESSVNEVLQNGGKGFLQKPFTIEELSVQVRESLK